MVKLREWRYAIIFFLLAFIYRILIKQVSDQTLYDRTLLPESDPNHLTYKIEPPSSTGSFHPLPNIFLSYNIDISFMIPAYNEEERLPSMLKSTLKFLKTKNFSFEIVIVDDGSRDKTAEIVLEFAQNFSEIRLIRQPINMGKGAAVQVGCLYSRGKYILMLDADGATDVECFDELYSTIVSQSNAESIVVGSRSTNESHRTLIRSFLSKIFHFMIILSGVKKVKDTQCGFKLFSREAARWLFTNQHVHRWCFDAELLGIAEKRKMAVIEIPVKWNEVGGSKMKIRGMINMFIDLIRISLYYRIYLWTIKIKPTSV